MVTFKKDLTKYFTPKELKNFSPNLQNYVRAMFGLEGISQNTEKELWERLTPDEQKQATEITKRLVKFKTNEPN